MAQPAHALVGVGVGLRDGVAWLDLNDRAGVLSWLLQRLAKRLEK